MGYVKNIAVIRGLKDGFSADGGSLSGLVKAERYGFKLRLSVSYINFAPLTEGRYVTAVTDGANTEIVEGELFEGESALDTDAGFAALVCFINGGVFPVASAVCGNFRGEALGLKAEVERRENINAGQKKQKEQDIKEQCSKEQSPAPYEDEAIAEENYYEYEALEGGGALREDKEKEESGRQKPYKNETAVGSVEDEKTPENGAYIGGNGLAGGDFYSRMKGEIEGVLKNYPREKSLERLIAGSKWVKISYGENGFYVFGVIYSGGNADYICYGVPSSDTQNPPESMRDTASFIPAEADGFAGFWVMYQDARTGATLRVEIG
ncbi:MAG: hypothetical protein NC489_46815 [Ruminococcus flavefaciens]|nr:hypothetical protein [Ruminococcus flavefaciens]